MVVVLEGFTIQSFVSMLSGLEDWDIVPAGDPGTRNGGQSGEGGSLLGTITGTITSSVGKTVSTVSKAIGNPYFSLSLLAF